MARFWIGCSLLGLLILHLVAWAVETPASSARDYLASMRQSRQLQAFLDTSVRELTAADPKLRRAALRIALMDLNSGGPPLLAHWQGKKLVYPASVVKFVYLMATYAWQEQGKLRIDGKLDRLLQQMIYHSSNRATQQVVARLTATQPGPELPPMDYQVFRQRRLVVKRWLQTLGIADLHSVHPTYDGNGDLFGRDVQFLKDPSLKGGIASRNGEFHNRQAMTAVGTAKLLALLATDRALSPENSAAVRQRMRRDPKEQPYLVRRIAGGITRLPGFEVYSKTGTWGPIFADAGIIHHESGRQMVLVVFIEASPAYRGSFIADLAHRSAAYLVSPE